jgi:predicted GH43/DUF377 family glycosyl hydrolase
MNKLLFLCTIFLSLTLVGILYGDFLSGVDPFHNIFYFDDGAVIVGSELLHIEGYPHAFNASFIEHNNGYMMVFRQDTKKKPNVMPSTIRMVRARFTKDSLFSNEAQEYRMGHCGAHDARLFRFNGELYLLYTYLVYKNKAQPAHNDVLTFTEYMRQALARLDENGDVAQVIELNYGTQKKEKNWTPFEYKDDTGKSYLYFVYRFNPREIICVQGSGHIEPVIREHKKSDSLINIWERQWGEIRGGTPAIKVGDEYLTFFHSSFKHKKQRWYVFGALTFKSNPPFTITRISPCPILAHNFYSAESSDKRLFGPNMRVLFPCGLICESNYIYVLCGENDVGIRLITFDKMHLMDSLIPI